MSRPGGISGKLWPQVVRSAAAIALALLVGSATLVAQGYASSERGAAALGSTLNSLGNTSRVLVIGAHPDDEDTQLIAWLARGRHVETAYLSLTRGDGGQNLLGNELGELLGVIRTQELLAARRIDGGRQFFTRAFDFGFSKNAEETFKHWPKDSVMGDVVRVVRAFRPQIIVAIFSGTPADGHGHHQVSGILAKEVYETSMDTVLYPVATYGTAWTASKFYRRIRTSNTPATRINVGEFDPLIGRSYAEIAADSRSQHKSQGFGQVQPKGTIIDQIGLEASRVSDVAQAATEGSIFAGIDTTWTRLANLATRADVKAALDSANDAFLEARKNYLPNDPVAIVPVLARAVRLLRVARDSSGPTPPQLTTIGPMMVRMGAPNSGALQLRGINVSASGAPPVDNSAALAAVAEVWNATNINLQRAERALLDAAGIAIEATGPHQTLAIYEAVKRTKPDTMPVAMSVFNRGKLPIRVLGARIDYQSDSAFAQTVAPDSTLRLSRLARTNNVTTQWWRSGTMRTGDLFTAPLDARDAAEREAVQGIVATVRVEVAGVPVDAQATVVNRVVDPVKGEQLVAVAGVPGITIGLDRGLEYIRAGVPVVRKVKVNIASAYQSAESVTVSLTLPKGLTADSIKRVRILTPSAATATVVFTVSGILAEGKWPFFAVAQHDASVSMSGDRVINYDHINVQRLYSNSSMWLVAVPVTLPKAVKVAYIPGVGDAGMEALQQLDVPVERIELSAVATTDFSRFTTVVVGPRAYASNDALVENNSKLLEFTKKGGTMVVQYGQNEMMRPGIMPFPIQLARTAERVTLEEAPVTILAPNSPMLNSPNKIGARDWEGWVQERATYMPSTFDSHYAPVLQMNDPNEPPNKSGLLVASYGRGTYVYVTLALFRQLPNGVPGAARILLNLISATPAAPPRM
ncbi:MAG: PIG-L family deacetylase [Gemmatimonas sp.]